MKITLYIIAGIVSWVIAFFLYSWHMKRKYSIQEKVELTLPKSWKELTDKQFLFVCQLLLMDNTPDEILSKCFLFFNNIKVIEKRASGTWLCKIGRKKFSIRDYEVLYFSKKLLFLIDNIRDVKPLRSLAGLKPINSRFEGIPFKQWLAAENYYQAFLYTKEEQYLNMLCAVIYSDGITFNDSETFKRAKSFSKLPDIQRFSVFIVYMGFKELLSNQFSYFFKKTIGQPAETKRPPNMREHINNMLNALDGGDATKTDQILEIDSWRAFDKLNRKAREIKETEERLSKMTKK